MENGTDDTPRPEVMHIVDKTAQPDDVGADGKIIPGKRVHQMQVAGELISYEFFHNKPLPMPYEVAVRFLKHDAFVLTDEDGNRLAWDRSPRQPDELEAGEEFKLKPGETIARFDELHLEALRVRALQIAGGERFGRTTNRQAMIDFIVSATATVQEHNRQVEDPEEQADRFTPSMDFFPTEDAA